MPIWHKPNAATVQLFAFSPSIGASPVAAYMQAPFRGRVFELFAVIGGALSTSNCTVTVVNVTTGVTIGAFVVTQAGSAAGQLFTGEPTSAAAGIVSRGDVISFTPSGSAGASVTGSFRATFQPGGV